MLRHITRNYLKINRQLCSLNKVYSSTTVASEHIQDDQPKKEISKAMKAYLERAKEHDEFMKDQQNKYRIGKRHLANMMGENPETFTQEDVDEAIAYLFPSGLFEKKARPMMKPPEEIFPARKAAEFDEMGRPHHFLFYTSSPNFYQLLYDAVHHINECNRFEDTMLRKNNTADPNLQLQDSGYQWVDKLSLEKKLVETLTEKQYSSFLTTMERLFVLPYSYRVSEFIQQFRRPLISQTKTTEIPKPQYEPDGSAFITTHDCMRKNARGSVTIRSPGSGLVSINDQDIRYFEDTYCREQVSHIYSNSFSVINIKQVYTVSCYNALCCLPLKHLSKHDYVNFIVRNYPRQAQNYQNVATSQQANPVVYEWF